MTKISTLICVFLFSGVVNAKDQLTLLNAGSKTGSFAIQMTTLAQDLGNDFDIDLKIPGDHCTALQMMDNIKGPFIMPYANDHEAIGRDGDGCQTLSFDTAQVIRYDTTAFAICSMNGNNDTFMTQSNKVGHSLPATVFARSINAINTSFGADLTPIPYDGSGATKTALYNGEVDYVLLSIKHGRDIMSNGGQCHYEFSGNSDSDLIALGTLDVNNKQFIAGYDAVWLAYNMTDEQINSIRSVISRIHADSSSGMYEYTAGGANLKYYFDLDPSEIEYRWESSVANLQK